MVYDLRRKKSEAQYRFPLDVYGFSVKKNRIEVYVRKNDKVLDIHLPLDDFYFVVDKDEIPSDLLIFKKQNSTCKKTNI